MNRKEELEQLIEDLKDDLANRPTPKEFKYDFLRDMAEKALNKARRELATLEFEERREHG